MLCSRRWRRCWRWMPRTFRGCAVSGPDRDLRGIGLCTTAAVPRRAGAARMGDVGLVVALDSGAGSYDERATTSLRGLVNGTMTVRILTEGVHLGATLAAAVPSTFRIARQLLDRIDSDSATGMTKSPVFNAPIPDERVTRRRSRPQTFWATWCGSASRGRSCGGAHEFTLPTTKDPVELILNRTWRASLSVTGADGLLSTKNAGNVRGPTPRSSSRCASRRFGRRATAVAEVKRLVEQNTPYKRGGRLRRR